MSSSTSTRTTFGSSRWSSTHWAETRAVSRLMWFLPFCTAGLRAARGRGSAGGRSPEEQVDLAAQAEAEDGVEQGGGQGETRWRPARARSRPARNPTRPTTAKPRPTACANRGGRGSSSSCGGARRGRTNVRNSQAYGVCWMPRSGPDREHGGLHREQPRRDRRRRDQHERRARRRSGWRRTRGPRGSMPATTAGRVLASRGHGAPDDGRRLGVRSPPRKSTESVEKDAEGRARVRTFDTATSARGSGRLRAVASDASRTWIEL